MTASPGRFTVRGSDAVERQLTSLTREVADRVAALVPQENRVALLLIGGYGRGEGGVETVDGVERPHNNLDFLLIARSPQPGLQERLDQALEPIRSAHGLGIDLSLTTPRRLWTSPPLILWHDMRFGHKTLLGDPGFVPSLSRFTAEKIPPSDVRNLLVNRGTLLVINRLLLVKSPDSPAVRRTVVKHAVKAIIGYGDALLFFRGAYHWSYQEKQRRMRARTDVPETFRRLYDEAMEFRFQPSYPEYLKRDPHAWMSELEVAFERIHLECEQVRLGAPGLQWDDYLPTALRRAVWEDSLSLRGWARKLRNGLRPEGPAGGDGRTLPLRLAGWPGTLPLLFPAVAYRPPAPDYLEAVRSLLRPSSPGGDGMVNAYLKAWGAFCDPNFPKVLQALNLRIDD